MQQQQESVSIWIWVGLVLCTYGVLVLGTSLCHLSQPPVTVLGHLRPGIWWGGVMTVVGAVFLYADREVLRRLVRREEPRR